ncbi:MAG: acyl-CoA/acyl-ACP dehydrogenase [Acidobacteriota bacterium]|nr:acyl-CoA/acyl-ACP dehydrogenase [Acidobacteriota bacterium]
MISPYFSPPLLRLHDEMRQIAAAVAAPRAAEVDEKRMWPAHTFEALASAGLLGLHVPEELGGHGQGLLALASLTEILAQSCSSSSICYGMHCVGTAVIAAKPSDYHRERYLAPIAAGKHVTTLSLSEPGTGVHFYLPTTQLIGDGDEYVLRGLKHFVTNGGHVNSYVVSTVASDASHGEFTCILVDENTPGMHWSGEWDGFGMRGNSSIVMNLDDARVPQRNLLGEEGDQIWYVFEVVAPYFLIAMAGTYLGIAQAALDYTVNHLRTRVYTTGSEPPANADVLQHRVGALWSRLEATRQFLYSAAFAGDSGDAAALPAILSSKAQISDVAVEVVNECMTLCGGIAYRENSLLARLLRDVRASHVMAPTTDLLRLWTGRALLGQPLL